MGKGVGPYLWLCAIGVQVVVGIKLGSATWLALPPVLSHQPPGLCFSNSAHFEKDYGCYEG